MSTLFRLVGLLWLGLGMAGAAPFSTDPSGKVASSAMGAVGSSSPVHGVVVHTADTQWGRLACAGVVSAILKHAGAGVGIHFTTTALRDALRRAGWKRVEVKDLARGDVVFWGADATSRPGHVGVIVSTAVLTLTVDNNALLRRVGLHPLSRPIIAEFSVAQYGLRHPRSTARAHR